MGEKEKKWDMCVGWTGCKEGDYIDTVSHNKESVQCHEK